MTELLAKAIEEVSKLPREAQNKVAQRLLAELSSAAGRKGETADLVPDEAVVPRPELRALVGLLDEPLDVDAYLDRTRGPAWDAALDGEA